ncbi:carbamoyl-phosphate synthase large subunit [Fusobacterium naviforme]|nr:ATP-grasp domain-containing protein [Fusobacterium naviforme]PSL10431.1 carbamoyl-phosphate synthase large subunit [Fusobacterium naviforme]STO28128.1 carbamoyl phosphate synthase-like protein [Fusobacterium naviforme]
MKTVIVTAIGSFSAAAVIRGCREAGLRIVGTDLNAPELLAESVELDRFVQLPRYDAGRAYLDGMLALCREEGAAALLPLTDAELDILNAAREELLPTELWSPAPAAVLAARDKRRSREAAERVFAKPQFAERFSAIPTLTFQDAENAPLPLVLKPFDGRSSEGLYRVTTEAERQACLEGLRAQGRAERYLAQPLIPGMVVCVDTVRDMAGHCIALPREEYLRTPNGAGLSVHVFRDTLLEALCGALSEELGICGCVNYEFIHAEDGRYFFLECNPRFSGGVGFSAAAGCDMVRMHLNICSGGAVDSENPAKDCWIVKKYIEVVTK